MEVGSRSTHADHVGLMESPFFYVRIRREFPSEKPGKRRQLARKNRIHVGHGIRPGKAVALPPSHPGLPRPVDPAMLIETPQRKNRSNVVLVRRKDGAEVIGEIECRDTLRRISRQQAPLAVQPLAARRQIPHLGDPLGVHRLHPLPAHLIDHRAGINRQPLADFTP